MTGQKIYMQFSGNMVQSPLITSMIFPGITKKEGLDASNYNCVSSVEYRAQ